MRLYLLRHGTAEERGTGDDAERALVDKGRKQCRRVAALLGRLGVEPALVLTSPLRRARETAQETLLALGVEERVVAEGRLAPGGSVSAAVEAVLAAGWGLEHVLVVGHEPMLSELAAQLVVDPPGALHLDLRKSGLVEIEVLSRHPPRGALIGLIRPAHLE